MIVHFEILFNPLKQRLAKDGIAQFFLIFFKWAADLVLAGDATGAQFDDAIGLSGDGGVVGDDDEGHAQILVETAHHMNDFGRCFGI